MDLEPHGIRVPIVFNRPARAAWADLQFGVLSWALAALECRYVRPERDINDSPESQLIRSGAHACAHAGPSPQPTGAAAAAAASASLMRVVRTRNPLSRCACPDRETVGARTRNLDVHGPRRGARRGTGQPSGPRRCRRGPGYLRSTPPSACR